jgi:hypothetical protein
MAQFESGNGTVPERASSAAEDFRESSRSKTTSDAMVQSAAEAWGMRTSAGSVRENGRNSDNGALPDLGDRERTHTDKLADGLRSALIKDGVENGNSESISQAIRLAGDTPEKLDKFAKELQERAQKTNPDTKVTVQDGKILIQNPNSDVAVQFDPKTGAMTARRSGVDEKTGIPYLGEQVLIPDQAFKHVLNDTRADKVVREILKGQFNSSLDARSGAGKGVAEDDMDPSKIMRNRSGLGDAGSITMKKKEDDPVDLVDWAGRVGRGIIVN